MGNVFSSIAPILKEKFGRIRLRKKEEHDHQGSVGKPSSSGGQAEEGQAGLIQTQPTIEEEQKEERHEIPNMSPNTPEKLETDEDDSQDSQDDS